MINLNIDAYGTYARVSAAADMLEIMALRGSVVSREWAADWFADSHAVRGILRDHFMEGGEAVDISFAASGSIGEESDESLEAAERVFTVLKERASLLGPRYPFLVTSERVEVKDNYDPRVPYLALLWITALHAFSGTEHGFPVTDFFEDFVETAMSSAHLNAAGLGAFRRSGASFEAALEAATLQAGFRVTKSGGVRRIHAHDEKTDIIARFPWPDQRPLHWVFLIQATCGRSDTWHRKMSEPSPSQWQNLLRLQLAPRAVLAVPHHITRDTLSWLGSRSRDVLILDRIPLSSLSRCFPVRYEELFELVEDFKIA